MSLPRDSDHGYALLLTLFVCLGTALLIAAATAVVLCAERALADEASGRQRMHEKDEVLASLAWNAGEHWAEQDWAQLGPGNGSLETVPGSGGWLLRALARQDPGLSRLTVDALVERGRDGIDLPVAAAVASYVSVALNRVTPWLQSGDGGGAAFEPAPCYLVQPTDPALVGEGCALGLLSGKWHVDPGWAEWLRERTGSTAGDPTSAPAETAHPGPQLVVLSGGPGKTLVMPAGAPGASPEDPVLAIVTGGADLNLTGCGDLYGVVVVDGGSLSLDGTTLHGAVFVTERLDVGATGQILFEKSILRWATDRSLVRTRLMPGSRQEGTD